MVAANEELVTQIVEQIVEQIRRAKEERPEHSLSFHYVEAFRYWAPALKEDHGLSGAQVTEMRFAVLKQLSLRD